MEERELQVETMRALIKAECLRIYELLDSQEDLCAINYGSSIKPELKNKMHELRRDTLRLQRLI